MYQHHRCQNRNRSCSAFSAFVTQEKKHPQCDEVCSFTDFLYIPLVFAAVTVPSLCQLILSRSLTRAALDHSATQPPAGVSLAFQRPG